MREIASAQVTAAVRDLCVRANYHLPRDVAEALEGFRREETWPVAEEVLSTIGQNIQVAARGELPLCQDTGLACVFVELGQEVLVTGGSLEEAVQEGVRQGYGQGYLRKSVVSDPLFDRANTGDNTPALITWEVAPGEGLTITVAPKGAGSENMSRLGMLRPADGVEGVRNFVLAAVREAGPNPCPPVVVGVGIGGSFDRVALLAKRALLRPLDSAHPDPRYAALEAELLEEINALGIGPQGFGGRTTALGVRIEAFPAHIAQLPVAVNINCHVARHATIRL